MSASPAEATAAGIVCIFQELSLIPDLSVADNIFIDRPPRRLGLIDRKTQHRRAEEILARIRCEDVDPRMAVRDLSLSRRQMVEIAKAIGKTPHAVVIGSKIIQLIENEPHEKVVTVASHFLRSIRKALDA